MSKEGCVQFLEKKDVCMFNVETQHKNAQISGHCLCCRIGMDFGWQIVFISPQVNSISYKIYVGF